MVRTIQMITTIGEDCITYEVIDGDALLGDMGDARTVWVSTVNFSDDKKIDEVLTACSDLIKDQRELAVNLVKSRE